MIVAGGWTPKDGWGPGPTYTAELWNPKTNAFAALPPMPVATARAVGHWLPGHAGQVLLFAEGTSSDLPAFDVATHTWFDAGAFGMGSQEGACAFFPFRFKGGFYAWQRYRTQGFYSSKNCESDDEDTDDPLAGRGYVVLYLSSYAGTSRAGDDDLAGTAAEYEIGHRADCPGVPASAFSHLTPVADTPAPSSAPHPAPSTRP